MHHDPSTNGEIRPARHRATSGFTLLELMIALVVISVLAAIAIPAYGDYLLRGRLAGGTALLKSTRQQLEQRYSDNRSYADAGGACAIAPFLDTDSTFGFACTVSAAGQQFVLTATGTGPTTGFTYSIDEAGVERTLAVRSGWTGASLPVNRFIVRKE
ncbi:MAG: type IV pilin protein [Lautropia sp.]